MSLSDKAVEAIQDSVKTEEMVIEGVTYTTRPVFDPRKPDPVATALGIHTLGGLIYYVKDNPDGIGFEDFFVHVEGHGRVTLTGALEGDFRQRETLIIATFEQIIGKTFNFGAYYDSEAFIIGLQSLFLPTAERDAVLKLVGNLRDEKVATHADDGVTQTVTARTGIARVNEIDVPNPVILQPYRTFREVQQPASPFILRMKAGSPLPTIALFESDGGQWKLDAIERIAVYLKDAIGEEVKVIA